MASLRTVNGCQRCGASLAVACLLTAGTGQELRHVEPRNGHLLYLPKKMWSSRTKWPLILFLHGRSLRGSDLNKVASYGLPKRLKTDKGFPFIVVAPQLPANQRWTDTRALASLVNDVASMYPVDRTRVYAMGFSMGGSGAWRVAHDYPSMFAAVVSVAGSYEKPLATSGRLKTVPIWVIHGTADKDSSPEVARWVLDTHVKKGGIGHFTGMAGKGHNIPHVFEGSSIYKWALGFRNTRRWPVKL